MNLVSYFVGLHFGRAANRQYAHAQGFTKTSNPLANGPVAKNEDSFTAK
jgi:hypothetical protein